MGSPPGDPGLHSLHGLTRDDRASFVQLRRQDPLRLAAVRRYARLLPGPQPALDGIVRLAAQLCTTPAATLLLFQEDEVGVVAACGLGSASALAVDDSLCEALLCGEPLVVVAGRLADPPAVTGWPPSCRPPSSLPPSSLPPSSLPSYRFRAGVPLVSPDGHVVGGLCVLDTVPRTLLPERTRSLATLAVQAVQLLDLQDRADRLAEDVARRELLEATLREGETRLQSLLDHSDSEVWVKDLAGRYLYVNQAYRERRGWTATAVEGSSDADLLPAAAHHAARQLDAEVAATGQPVVREHGEIAVDGRRREYLTVHVPLLDDDGVPYATAAMATDVTDLRDARRELVRSALHDPLTGLPNRTLVRDRAERALARAATSRGRVAALRVDLDGFAGVTLAHGSAVGDAVLVEVARRLVRAAGHADTVARLSADEFLVLCEQQPGAPPVELVAQDVARRVQESLHAPVRVGDEELPFTASLGLAWVVARGLADAEAEELLRDSAAALSRAKALGRDRLEVVDQRLRQEAAGRSRVEAALRSALASGRGLAVHYQPIVDLRTGAVVGLEALVRLSGPDGHPLPTDLVIACAEASGLVVPLGTAVLRQACRDVAGWRGGDGCGLVLSVNLSARQVARPELVDVVESALGAAGLPASALALELTETALLEAAPTALASLHTLRGRGVEVGVDDFGTGYASLRYLRELPVSFLKVDRSFVAGLPDDADDAAIVTAVLGLAKALRLHCVAEGIERPAQAAWLQAHEGVLGQGYLMARPLPARGITRLLTSRTSLLGA